MAASLKLLAGLISNLACGIHAKFQNSTHMLSGGGQELGAAREPKGALCPLVSRPWIDNSHSYDKCPVSSDASLRVL